MGLDHGFSVRINLFTQPLESLPGIADMAKAVSDLLGITEHIGFGGFVKVQVDPIVLRKAYHIADFIDENTDVGDSFEVLLDPDVIPHLKAFCESYVPTGDDPEWAEEQNKLCLEGIEHLEKILEKHKFSDVYYWQSY